MYSIQLVILRVLIFGFGENPVGETMSADLSVTKETTRFADRVYETVKSMAMAYEIRPGDRINEVELAKRLDVSRTPLREALNRLVIEGIITTTANKGFFVRGLTAEETFSLYEFRSAIEAAAVRFACERATRDEVEELEKFVRSSRAEKDDDLRIKFLRLDEEFHTRLAEISHNDEFVRAIKNINSRIHFVRWIDIQHGGRTQTQNEHLRIVKAIKKKDGDEAVRQIELHINRRMDQISDVIKAGFAEIYTGNNLARHLLRERSE